MVVDKDWLDAHGLSAWLRDEYGLDAAKVAAIDDNVARRMRAWEDGEADFVHVYTADRYLTALGIPLALVPDDIYLEGDPRGGGQSVHHLRSAALKMLDEGATQVAVARHLGISDKTVRKWAHEVNPVPRRKVFSPEARKRAIELVRSGASRAQAAREVGTSSRTVGRWLQGAGV